MKTKEELLGKPESRAVFYTVLYSDFRRVAIECGYALAIHGSMARDMDLIAVAWTEEALSPQELIEKINTCIGGTVWQERNISEFEYKPHRRITYTLSIMGDWFIDFSIIPPFKEPEIICETQ